MTEDTPITVDAIESLDEFSRRLDRFAAKKALIEEQEAALKTKLDKVRASHPFDFQDANDLQDAEFTALEAFAKAQRRAVFEGGSEYKSERAIAKLKDSAPAVGYEADVEEQDVKLALMEHGPESCLRRSVALDKTAIKKAMKAGGKQAEVLQELGVLLTVKSNFTVALKPA